MSFLKPFQPETSSGALTQKLRASFVVGALLVAPSLSTSSSAPHGQETFPTRASMQTSTGLPIETSPRRSTSGVLSELRRLSGLTWDQLSRFFGVSRRTIHFWASGQAMSASNEEKLQQALAKVKSLDQGSASATRSLLLAVDASGRPLLESMSADIGTWAASPSLPADGLARSGVSKRTGTYQAYSPIELLSAVQEGQPINRGAVRSVKTARVKSARA